MNSKYDLNRRIFLSQLSKSLGLVTASSLFSLKSFAQTAKKNVVFVYFNYSALIPRRNTERGEFHLSGNSVSTGPLNAHKSDALFIRGASVDFFNGGGHAGHFPNHIATLTGFAGQGQGNTLTGANGQYDGTSVDIVAGDHLKKTYNTNVSHTNLAYSTQHADKGNEVNGGFLWRTVSFKRQVQGGKVVAQPVGPNISPTQLFSSVNGANGQVCTTVNTGPQANDTTAQAALLKKNIRNSTILLNNMKDFKSTYLIPKLEYDKLESQTASKLSLYQRQLADLNKNDNTNTEKEVCVKLNAPNASLNAWKRNDFRHFQDKSNAFFDIIAASFARGYCRSFTYYTSAFAGGVHPNAHKSIVTNGQINGLGLKIAEHNREIFKAVDSLIKKLKNAGQYEDTMIVLAGEFPHQNDGKTTGLTNDHRIDNMPWLVINSGKSGEYNRQNHGKVLHPGDIHVSILNKLGMPIQNFGSNRHESKRRGDNSKLIF